MKNHHIRSKLRRFLCLAAALLMLWPQTVTAGGHITAAEKNYTVTQGGMLKIPLEEVFTDREGHALTYSVVKDDRNQATTNISGSTYFFTSRTAGEYAPVVAASCGQERAEVTLHITVEPGAEGDPRQYGYDETPAGEVTVYVTVSSDGVPLMGEGGTLLMGLPVTVRYFDLADYGRQDLYRCATQGGKGGYVGDTVIERPTLLHLYICLLERYYMDLPAEKCGKGTSGLIGHRDDDHPVMNINGEVAYESRFSALQLTGSSTSIYMKEFWGHDENLMYYRNHMFPLMDTGWGSTCDYILLSDGDTIDVAMFTDWSFYNNGGAFCCFNQDSYTVTAGKPLTVQTLKYDTKSVSDGGTESFTPIDKLTLEVYNDSSECVDTAPGENGSYTVVLDKPGTYYLLGIDPNAGTEAARCAPAVARVTVRDVGAAPEGGDVKRGQRGGHAGVVRPSVRRKSADGRAADCGGFQRRRRRGYTGLSGDVYVDPVLAGRLTSGNNRILNGHFCRRFTPGAEWGEMPRESVTVMPRLRAADKSDTLGNVFRLLPVPGS